jgi:hypothetical protein
MRGTPRDRRAERAPNVEAAGLAPTLEDRTQPLIHFAGDFPLDRFGHFFPAASARFAPAAANGRPFD